MLRVKVSLISTRVNHTILIVSGQFWCACSTSINFSSNSELSFCRCARNYGISHTENANEQNHLVAVTYIFHNNGMCEESTWLIWAVLVFTSNNSCLWSATFHKCSYIVNSVRITHQELTEVAVAFPRTCCVFQLFLDKVFPFWSAWIVVINHSNTLHTNMDVEQKQIYTSETTHRFPSLQSDGLFKGWHRCIVIFWR